MVFLSFLFFSFFFFLSLLQEYNPLFYVAIIFVGTMSLSLKLSNGGP